MSVYSCLFDDLYKNGKGNPSWKCVLFLLASESDNAEMSTSDINVRIKLAPKTIKNALNYFIENGMVIEKSKHLGRGRPEKYYCLSDRYLDKMSLLGESIKYRSNIEKYSACIDSIFFLSQRKSDASQKLSIPQQVLLCILLLHSNEFGVIGSLSMTELSNMTGSKIHTKQLQKQIAKLVHLNLISKLVSGGSGTYLFGKWNSVYRINFDTICRLLDIDAPPKNSEYIYMKRDLFEVSRVYQFVEEFKGEDRSLANDGLLKYFKKHYKHMDDKTFNSIAPFFRDSITSKVPEYLQLKMYEYTCKFIVTSTKNTVGLNEIHTDFKNELLPSKKSYSDKSTDILIDVLLSICHSDAKSLLEKHQIKSKPIIMSVFDFESIQIECYCGRR